MAERLLDKIAEAVKAGDVALAEDLTRKAIELALDPMEIVSSGLTKGAQVIGDKFSSGEAFIFDLMQAGEAMKAGLVLVEPIIKKKGIKRKTIGRVVIGTVAGDIHDIGKSIVITALNAAGFEVIDLGVDVQNAEFIKAVKEFNPDILGLSSLLSVTRPSQRQVIELLGKAGLRDKVKVVIGGAVVSQEYAEKIGADAYAADVNDAVIVAKKLLGIGGE